MKSLALESFSIDFLKLIFSFLNLSLVNLVNLILVYFIYQNKSKINSKNDLNNWLNLNSINP